MGESYGRARALTASDSDFQFTRASVYFTLGLMDKAQRDAEASVAAAPENPYGHYLLSSIYETLGQGPAALASVQRAAESGRSARTDAVVRHGALSHGDDDATGATAGIRLTLADQNPVAVTEGEIMTVVDIKHTLTPSGGSVGHRSQRAICGAVAGVSFFLQRRHP